MKRTIFLISLLAVLTVIPVFAQETDQAQSARESAPRPRPQLMALHLGLPIGWDLPSEGLIAGLNFGISMVFEDMMVGYDYLLGASLLRMGYSFIDQAGMSIGIGKADDELTAAIGAFWYPFQNITANGISYGLSLRAEYLTPTNYFYEGKILVTLGSYFGF